MEKFPPVNTNDGSDSSEPKSNVEIEIVVQDEFDNNSYEEPDSDISFSNNYYSNKCTIILSSNDELAEEDGEQEHNYDINDGDLSENEVMNDLNDYDFHFNDFNEYYDDNDVLNINISDEEGRYLLGKIII